jgi:hypothetical protein
MAIQWTGVLSGARDLLLDGETVSITVEDNRTIHLPRSLFFQAASHGPVLRDAWETALGDGSAPLGHPAA